MRKYFVHLSQIFDAAAKRLFMLTQQHLGLNTMDIKGIHRAALR